MTPEIFAHPLPHVFLVRQRLICLAGDTNKKNFDPVRS